MVSTGLADRRSLLTAGLLRRLLNWFYFINILSDGSMSTLCHNDAVVEIFNQNLCKYA